MRLFVGIGLPDDARARIQRALADGARPAMPGRPVPSAGWHLTLFFLGEVAEPRASDLAAALRAAALGARFGLTVTGAGAFPRPSHARILWLGVGGDVDRLRALQADVTHLVAPFGFEPEDRPYAPHLTLSRVTPPADARPWLTAFPTVSVPWAVDRVTLFKSAPGPHGSVYTPVAETPLLA